MNNAAIKEDSLPAILRTLRGLKNESRRRYKADLRAIFGSYVKNEQRTNSDLDVLVEFDKGANLLDLVGLSMYLEEKLGLPVDIVPESELRPELKTDILKEAVLV